MISGSVHLFAPSTRRRHLFWREKGMNFMRAARTLLTSPDVRRRTEQKPHHHCTTPKPAKAAKSTVAEGSARRGPRGPRPKAAPDAAATRLPL